jgi:UDP-N-acetylmuramyl pentapeptide synthase
LVAGARPMLWPMVLHMPGRHNVMNALAGYAVGSWSGVEQFDAVGALERMRPTEKRGNLLEWRGAEIVNDTYNSNPKALEGMVEALIRRRRSGGSWWRARCSSWGRRERGCMRLVVRRWQAWMSC